MDARTFFDDTFFGTVRILTKDEHSRGASIGTGFLCSTEIEGGSALLLISNKHVYGDASNPIELVFHLSRKNLPMLGERVIVKQANFARAFTPHPDPTIDLACLNVSTLSHPQFSIFYRAFDES